ncbi:MAG: Do family serine endopeptidase [Opitutaceae bacterium]|nr:Do family serine endopeptidase [Opitutaceae bacterium]
MPSRPFLRLVGALLALAPSVGCSAEKVEREAATPKVEVRVDREPVDRSNQPVITSYADALEQVRHSVVSVASTRIVRSRGSVFPFDDPLLRRFFGPGFEQREEKIPYGLGSGVIVSADGYVLTNNHVIEEADEIKVTLADGREIDASIVGTDPRTDVAVLKVSGSDFPHATLADSDTLRVGDIVFAVGNPLGVGQTTTMGIVSATGRSNLGIIERGYESFIQTDASINPGNSGGALVDAKGRVVGINTAIISTSRGSIGIGFAIPINLASSVMHSLVATGTVARGYLGVQMQDLDAELAPRFGLSEARGAIVADVIPDSPAERAGLRQDDVIVAFDGRPVANSTELRVMIAQLMPGSRAVIRVMRDGEPVEVTAELGTLEDETARGAQELFPGVTVAPVTPALRDEYGIPRGVGGLVVVDTAPRSEYGAVLVPGTVVVKINNEVVGDLRRARQLLGRGKNLVLINQRGTFRYIQVTVD